MANKKPRIDVMVSSTTNDLGEHRRSLNEIITNLLMTPRMMDNDAATGKDGLTYSLDLVDEAEVYILLLGFRYGYVPEDPIRNPDKLGMTHLEYRRAKERAAKGELCVFAFLLDDSLKPEVVRPELTAFRNEVLGDQVKFFTSIDDLKLQVMQTLSIAECVTDLKERGGTEVDFNPRTGEVLNGRYTFESKLGQGGNGEVWKAQERLTDGSSLTVAIKLLKPEISDNPRRIERFKKEIALTRRLRHPHIILTTTDGMVGEQFFAVMDYIEGQTLRDFIKGRQFSIEDTVRYLGQIAEALHAAHRQNVVHRDVKPENILVRDDKLYLGDFGLAVSPDEDMSLTATGELVGTKKYMSPEQWDNQEATPQTDIYPLAIIAYEMLTSEFPYDASSHARLLTQHLSHQLPEHPDLPDELLNVLRRATAKSPADRYESVTGFIAALENWQLDPENVETKVANYLATLRRRLKGDVYEKLFVDMEGDIREVIADVQQTIADDDSYDDPLFDDAFGDLLDGLMVELDADKHAPQTSEQQYVPNIIDQLLASERVVLVGEPGSGKSFTLRRLVMRYIREYLSHQRVPVFVPLNAFKGETEFEAYIKQQLGADLAPYYQQLRDNNQLILICDALNEMPRTASTDGRNLVEEVRVELTKAPYFVVSCRVRDYNNDLGNLKLERLEVRDLDLPAIREFVRRYKLLLKYDDDDLWQKMGGSEGLVRFWQAVRDNDDLHIFWNEDSSIPSYTSSSDDSDWQAMWTGAKLIPLSRNPYLARVICGLHGRDAMPTNRAELYQAFVLDLYERELKHAQARGQDYPERDVLEAFLTELANQMQAGQTTVLKRATIADAYLLQAALDATILTLDGDDLRFSHQLLQEYFAARTLLEKMMSDADPQTVFGDTWWNVTIWRETANMLIDFSKERQRVIQWIARASLPLADELIEAPTLITEPTRRTLIDNAVKNLQNPHPIGRAAAHRILGMFDYFGLLGGTQVIYTGVKDSMPDIDWVNIPAGKFTYGDDDKDGYSSFAPPAEQREMVLDSYDISRYPVTYAQFQCFVDAPDGLHSQEHDWFEGLAADESDKQLSEQYFKYSNHPREMINWYQAMAFCRWLSWKIYTLMPSSPALLPQGEGSKKPFDMMDVSTWAVRLPTEFEWEKAACGTDGRVYPYGNDFDAGKGNTRETGISKTSAVGIFSDGASPYEVLDMSGNVWEWCLSEYRNPAEHLRDENISSTSRRVLRGGSWDSRDYLARAVCRGGYDPDYRDVSFGFRVLRPPSL